MSLFQQPAIQHRWSDKGNSKLFSSSSVLFESISLAGPSAATVPPLITIQREQTSRIRSRSWEAMIRECAKVFSRLMSSRRDFGSRFAAGSSIARISGSRAMTAAMATALFCPLDKWWGGLSRRSKLFTRFRASCTSYVTSSSSMPRLRGPAGDIVINCGHEQLDRRDSGKRCRPFCGFPGGSCGSDADRRLSPSRMWGVGGRSCAKAEWTCLRRWPRCRTASPWVMRKD